VEERRQVRRLDRGVGEAEAFAQRALLDVLFLVRARIVVGEAVHADDGRAAVEQGRRQMRPDESGAAGDQGLHTNTSRTRAGSRHGLPDGSSAACTVLPVAATEPSSFRITSY